MGAVVAGRWRGRVERYGSSCCRQDVLNTGLPSLKMGHQIGGFIKFAITCLLYREIERGGRRHTCEIRVQYGGNVGYHTGTPLSPYLSYRVGMKTSFFLFLADFLSFPWNIETNIKFCENFMLSKKFENSFCPNSNFWLDSKNVYMIHIYRKDKWDISKYRYLSTVGGAYTIYKLTVEISVIFIRNLSNTRGVHDIIYKFSGLKSTAGPHLSLEQNRFLQSEKSTSHEKM